MATKRESLEAELTQLMADRAALSTRAKEVQRAINADRIITDSAMLMRAGAPFTLIDNKRMLDVAAVEAAHNRELRRYMQGTVKSKEVFGVPSIVQHLPKEK